MENIIKVHLRSNCFTDHEGFCREEDLPKFIDRYADREDRPYFHKALEELLK